MEGQLGLSELSVISWVSAIKGCLLSRVPLYSNVVQAPQISAGRFTHTSPPSLYTRALSSAPVLTRLLPKFYVIADKMCGGNDTSPKPACQSKDSCMEKHKS